MPSEALPSTSSGKRIQIHYSGSKAWLVFWLIVLFPVGLVLLVTAGEFRSPSGRKYFIRYNGSRGWLAFWTIAFFPIAVILFLLNGVSLHLGETESSFELR